MSAPVDVDFVLRASGSASDDSLYLTEIAPGARQAVALRHGSFRSAVAELRRQYGPGPTTRFHQTADRKLAVVTVRSEEGRLGETHLFAVAALSGRLVAFMEIHFAGDHPLAWGAAETLHQRVAESLQKVTPGALLERVIPWAMWIGAVTSTIAAIVISASPSTRTFWIVYGGFGLFSLACITALIAGVRLAGAGAPEAQPGDRVLTLWSHPWMLAAPAAQAPVPLATLALLLRTSRDHPVLGIAYWTTLALGLAVIFLGSNHRLLRQLRPPQSAGPEPVGGGWSVTPTIPEGFPALPEGRVLEVFAENGGGAVAVLIRPSEQREPEWTRFNHSVRTWQGARGPVSARAHQVWDQRIETIVEVVLGDRLILVESTDGVEATWGAVRRLTDHLESKPDIARRPAGPRSFLTYSLAPVWVQFFLAAYFWIGALAFRGQGLPQLHLYVAACAVSFVAAPMYLVLMNQIALRRLHYFAIGNAEIRARAVQGRTLIWVIAFPLLIPVMVFGNRYAPAGSLGWLVSIAIILALGAVVTASRLEMTLRVPGDVIRPGRRARNER